MAIGIGDIVTVILNDSLYCGEQGEVIEIVHDGDPDGPIGVQFGRWCRFFPGYLEEKVQFHSVRFEASDLRKDADWKITVKIFRRFGRQYHSYASLKHPFDPTKACMAQHCNNDAVERCYVNVWGTVYEIDLCKSCAELFDGKCGETMPQVPSSRSPAYLGVDDGIGLA